MADSADIIEDEDVDDEGLPKRLVAAVLDAVASTNVAQAPRELGPQRVRLLSSEVVEVGLVLLGQIHRDDPERGGTDDSTNVDARA